MLKEIVRHIRLAEFRLLFVGLLLVGMALSAVGLFTDRVEQGLAIRTSAILGADGLIRSTRPLDDEYTALAKQFGLEVAHSVSFMSMAITATESRLAGVRAVSSNYPLRGEVLLSSVAGSDTATAVVAPIRGTVWGATQLVQDLNLKPASDVQLGNSVLRFEREILLEPDGGAGLLRLAPRILMNIADLAQTGLITPASRAHFQLLVAGPKASLAAFGVAIEARLQPSQSWRVADLRRDEVRNTIGRVVSYLRVAILLAVVLAIVAMALAAQGLWGRQVHEIALLRCLGQCHWQTLKTLAGVYMLMAVPVSLVGIGLGYLLQHIALLIIQDITHSALPPPTWLPLGLAMLMCIIVVAGVMMPILLALKRVPTMALLRAGQIDGIRRNRSANISILMLVILVTIFLARDLWLAFALLSGLVFATAILWCTVRGIIGLSKRLVTPRPRAWYAALKVLSSNGGRSAWLISAFGATIFALVLLGVVRADLFAAWQKSVPPDAPNVFLMNIQPYETATLSALLHRKGISEATLYPIIRARISAINHQATSVRTFTDEDARHQINHDFSITELAQLPADNRISAGNWFVPNDNGFSVEQDIANTLGVTLGDRLTMDIGGLSITAPISSLREVKWDNMQPNFYLIASPGLLDDAPRSYITGIYMAAHRNQLIHQINQAHPSVTAIDLDMLLARVKTLSEQGGNAVSAVFVFTLLTALLVLFGVLQGQRSAREQEIALLKTLGAGRRFVRNTIILEFALLGALAGLIGASMALLSGWILAEYVFEFSYNIAWQWLMVSIAGAVIIIATVGYGSVRHLLGVLPIRLLTRENNAL